MSEKQREKAIARIKRLSPEELSARMANIARIKASKMTPEQRTAHAIMMNKNKWKKHNDNKKTA